jgi:NhaA family Na+:H+ antiporter
MNADPSTDAASHPPPRPDRPPEAWEPLLRLARLARRPLDRFLAIEAASGVLLLVAAAVALGLANSPFADDVKAFWQTPVGLQIGEWQFARSLEWIVNDGLMAIFFFVVGMEIRREIHHGELSTLRRAALPAAAALGGWSRPPPSTSPSPARPRFAPGGACRWPRTSRSQWAC